MKDIAIYNGIYFSKIQKVYEKILRWAGAGWSGGSWDGGNGQKERPLYIEDVTEGRQGPQHSQEWRKYWHEYTCGCQVWLRRLKYEDDRPGCWDSGQNGPRGGQNWAKGGQNWPMGGQNWPMGGQHRPKGGQTDWYGCQDMWFGNGG